MKIGVILAAYNCHEFIDECLEPWLRIKELDDDIEIIIAATSGRFSLYRDLGIPEKNSETISKLHTKGLDFMVSTSGDNLLEEDRSRDICLEYLKPHNCDIIWLLDGDEIYSEQQIRGIIDFMERRPDKEGFSIWLKNYAIKYPYFIPPWSRPTIYRNRIYGGIGRFYFDSFFEFQDGIHGIRDIEIEQIPKNVAFIDHYSWTDREATRDKIKYQNSRYAHNTTYPGGIVPEGGRCQYECDEDGIFFSKVFHQMRGIEIPSIHSYPTETLMANVSIKYHRQSNRFDVQSDYDISDYILIIKDLSTKEEYSRFELTISKEDVAWFIPPTTQETISAKGFKGYMVEIEKNGHTVHIENVHTKIGIR
jgi:hypothetical protein